MNDQIQYLVEEMNDQIQDISQVLTKYWILRMRRKIFSQTFNMQSVNRMNKSWAKTKRISSAARTVRSAARTVRSPKLEINQHHRYGSRSVVHGTMTMY